MIIQLVLPMLVAVTAGFSAGLVQRRLSPAVATWLLTGLALATAASVLWAMGTLGLGWLSQHSLLADWLGWCRAVVSHHDAVPTVVGVPSLLVLSAMIARGSRVALANCCAGRTRHRGDAVEFIPTDEPFAYALPGKPGHIVVSTGMLCCLEPDERTVLFAHEEAHLALGHHRYLAVANVAAAAVPFLRPLQAQVRFATERWADEVAAAHVGDRATVARALARAALAQVDHAAGLAFGRLGVRARVDALLRSPARRPTTELALTAGLTAVVAALAGAAVQLHHLVQLTFHACGVS